ncbi:MAG: type I phosphomannose isomerase catalytic subunit [Chloroflexota bacterium]
MTAPSLYPLKLDSPLHTKVWGGRRLSTIMGKQLPTDAPYGEAWEMHDTSVVVNGPLAGQTLGDLLITYGEALIGEHNDSSEGLPLLAKLLDANDWLSIQVHPNDEQAQRLEGQPRGKTEAWIVLYAEPNAQLVIGITPGTAPEVMAAAIENGTLEEHVVYADVQAGDVLLLEANTVHAVGPGFVIYEIQQSSNTTYRLYDWNRAGLDGKPRELHIEKGVEVANLEYLPRIQHVPTKTISPVVTLVESRYFKSNWYHLAAQGGAEMTLNTNDKFHALTCVGGTASVEAVGATVEMHRGQTVMIPASVGAYTLHGTGDLIQSWQPTSS